jgi:hypothetical protein
VILALPRQEMPRKPTLTIEGWTKFVKKIWELDFAPLDDKLSKIDAKIRQGIICSEPIEMMIELRKWEN